MAGLAAPHRCLLTRHPRPSSTMFHVTRYEVNTDPGLLGVASKGGASVTHRIGPRLCPANGRYTYAPYVTKQQHGPGIRRLRAELLTQGVVEASRKRVYWPRLAYTAMPGEGSRYVPCRGRPGRDTRSCNRDATISSPFARRAQVSQGGLRPARHRGG